MMRKEEKWSDNGKKGFQPALRCASTSELAEIYNNRFIFLFKVYVFSEYAVHKYSVEHEERNVWKVYLEKSDFPAALRYCSNDEAKLDQV